MGCCSSTFYPGLDQVDLSQECQPLSTEAAAHAEFQETVVAAAPEALAIIDEYQGCQDVVKQSMNPHATPKEMQACFNQLQAAVQQISRLWAFSNTLEARLDSLIINICRNASKGEGGVCNLNETPGLTNQLAYILQYCLVFDHIRMQRFVLQNDFSFYRRMQNKFESEGGDAISEDDTNNMSNFVQEHIPMIRASSKGADKAYQTNPFTASVLATLANTVLNMLKKKTISTLQRNYAATVMTGAALTFDRVDPVGVFHKSSPINIKDIIKILQKEFPNQPQLLGALHFSSKTFRTAPAHIQEMFE